MRGEQKKGSDIDILVEFYPDDLLGIKVDLVMKSALKPRIGKHILKEVVYI